MLSKNNSQNVSVEAEYSYLEESHSNCWTFEQLTAGQDRDRVVRHYVPLDATLWRYAVWYGRQEDRPSDESDNDFLSLDELEATT